MAIVSVNLILENSLSHLNRKSRVVAIQVGRAPRCVTEIPGVKDVRRIDFAVGNREPAILTVMLKCQPPHLLREPCRNPKRIFKSLLGSRYLYLATDRKVGNLPRLHGPR